MRGMPDGLLSEESARIADCFLTLGLEEILYIGPSDFNLKPLDQELSHEHPAYHASL